MKKFLSYSIFPLPGNGASSPPASAEELKMVGTITKIEIRQTASGDCRPEGHQERCRSPDSAMMNYPDKFKTKDVDGRIRADMTTNPVKISIFQETGCNRNTYKGITI
jgi:hypothetical protein